jgi:hypothetical protein
LPGSLVGDLAGLGALGAGLKGYGCKQMGSVAAGLMFQVPLLYTHFLYMLVLSQASATSFRVAV